MDSEAQSEVRLAAVGGSAPARIALELRILILADLGVSHEGGPIAVDRSSFAAVLASLAPRLTLTVKDCLGSSERELACSLRITSLADLHPDGIVEQVPILAGLVRARRLLASCVARQSELPAVQEELLAAFAGTSLAAALSEITAAAPAAAAVAPAAATPGPAGSDSIDALLARVDLPQGLSASTGPAASLAELLSAAVQPAPGGAAIDRQALQRLIDELDRRLSSQVAAILAAPACSNLESAWRGLKLLVDRADHRAGIRLEILPTSRDDALSDLFDKVFRQEYDNLSEIPLSLVLADFAFDRSTPDLEYLHDAARIADSLKVPCILAMDPGFWGITQARLLGSLPDLMDKVRGAEYAKWTGLRCQDSSLQLCLTANRLALRTPWHEATGAPVKRFSWQADAAAEAPLWGSGVWAMGIALCRSFAEAGVRFPCCGPGSPGALDTLPLLEYRTKKEQLRYPLEARLPDRKAFELNQTGFAPLVASSGGDSAWFRSAPTVHKPARYDSKEATRASFLAATLPYQLFSGMAAHAVQRIAMTTSGGAEAEIEQHFRERLLAFLAACEQGAEPDEVVVELNDNEDDPGLIDVTVRLRPHFEISGGAVDLMLGTTVPR